MKSYRWKTKNRGKLTSLRRSGGPKPDHLPARPRRGPFACHSEHHARFRLHTEIDLHHLLDPAEMMGGGPSETFHVLKEKENHQHGEYHTHCPVLAAHLDAAFDQGFIAFDAAGRIEISPALPAGAVAILGLSPALRLTRLSAAHAPYLAWQRCHVFRSK